MTGRLPGLVPAGMDPAQRALYDDIVAHEVPWAETGGARAIAADGSLLGPFNPLLFSPAIGAAMLGLFRADGGNTSLPPRVHEIVILTVGAAWHAAYELYAHGAIGKARGLPDAMIEAIASGKRPEFDDQSEASAYDFTWQLTHNHAIDNATYLRAAREFGQAGIQDMVVLTGLYLTVCAIVNTFEIPVPVGTMQESSTP
jgi:4-carboxymuconolactone decarboxylase